jgi:L-ascorbate metabolism protein UlaG (beta-lactamase superfamily)
VTIGQQRSPRGGQSAAVGSLRFIGNATVLLRLGGFTILTDPNFIHRGEQIPLGYGLTTTRLTDPALEIEDLPPLDLVVLSHWHADHFDRIAEERLPRGLPILTTSQAARELSDRGFTATVPLETWQTDRRSKDGAELSITAMPGRHAPSALAVALPDVMGSLVELGDGGGEPPFRLYITGDTIMYEGLREIPGRYPELDLALVHLGGTRVMGVTVTMDAEQGVELLQTVRPRTAVPIHYDDYEAFKSPLEDFVTAIRAAGLEDRVRYVAPGETLEIGPGADDSKFRTVTGP